MKFFLRSKLIDRLNRIELALFELFVVQNIIIHLTIDHRSLRFYHNILIKNKIYLITYIFFEVKVIKSLTNK